MCCLRTHIYHIYVLLFLDMLMFVICMAKLHVAFAYFAIWTEMWPYKTNYYELN